MRHAAGELPDGLKLLRLEQALACFLEHLLRLVAIGGVAHDLDEAGDPAPFIADRFQHTRRPITLAVLAHAPSFVFEASGPPRDVKRTSGLVALAILRREQDREAFA